MTVLAGKTVLGIDLGSNSLGWTLISNEDEGQKKIILASGVRVFEAGLKGLEQDGKGESRNAKRREARSSRRRLERLGRRLTKLASILQENGLFPSGSIKDHNQRHELLNALDKSLKNPYILRAEALDHKLEPFELGRAFYHICQRRGFLSNRKESAKKKDDEGKVKAGINELQTKINDSGSRTLGEYFSRVNPHEERIRTRYTSRKMYEDEFNLIWEAQKTHYPDMLTDTLRKNIHKAIFHQRPLKSQKNLVGMCEYEPSQRRAPWAMLDAQEFRYLQRVNDLKVIRSGEERPLTTDERTRLIEELEKSASLKFSKIRKLLGLQKTSSFNLEAGGEDNLPGNKTSTALRKIFKDQWNDLTREDKDKIVEDVLSIQKDDALSRRGVRQWKLDEDSAREFGGINLEPRYCALSRNALKKILPNLREGFPLATILRETYPDRWERVSRPLEILPPVKNDEIPEIRNPIVERTLSELRRVVNAVVKKHGKPGFIRIELARDLRRNAKEREKAFKNMRENEKRRKAAVEKILKEYGMTKPSKNDTLKVILAEECGWHCPYTGLPINMDGLLGTHPQFDIEHIIPLDRSLDDSFMNKTLCHAETNRNIKQGKTPYEAFHGTPEWEHIIDRVGKFRNTEKLKRFKMAEREVEEFFSDFSSRQLNDTRYATSRAKEYLGLLYGGINQDGIDAEGTRRVQAVGGQVTAYLRNEWGLNSILNDGPGKSRDDHRHHAIDAIVIALTEQSWVKALSDAARLAPKAGRRRFAPVAQPWDGFIDDARKAVQTIIPSHQVTKKVRGALHEETFYGRPYEKDGKKYTRTRVALESLTAKDIGKIVDKTVREIIENKIKELGIDDPKKAFKSPDNLPFIQAKTGKRIPIRKVKIEQTFNTYLSVGKGARERFVQSDSNHHMEIVEDLKTGKWEGHVVSMFEAHRRLGSKEPIVKKDHGEGKKFVFSVAGGETIGLDTGSGGKGIFVVRTVPQSKQIYFVPINDARKLADIGKTGLTATPESLRERNCKKVLITPMGEVRNASD